MVLFILDGSGYQPNADHHAIKAQGYSAFIAKSTQGATGRDSTFPHNYAGSKAAGLPFAAYHFVTERPAADQAANCAGYINDKSIPVFLDLERTVNSHPTLKNATDVARELEKRGYDVPVIYFPHFYWVELRRPDLPNEFALWQALYPSENGGYASDLYKHVPDSYWNPQGNDVPSLLQFSDMVHVDGYMLNHWDCSAYDGTESDLDAEGFFKYWVTPPKPPVAPAFPLSRGKWFGEGGVMSGHNLNDWQRQMVKRGWQLHVDGVYGPETRAIAIAFQHEKHLHVDGLIGINTWNAAWKAPVT